MRLMDIIIEESDYSDDVEQEASAVLVAAKASSLDHIDLGQFMDHMALLGYDLSSESARELLKKIPFVQLSGDYIRVSGSDGDDDVPTVSDDPEKNKEKISKMAQDAAKKDLR